MIKHLKKLNLKLINCSNRISQARQRHIQRQPRSLDFVAGEHSQIWQLTKDEKQRPADEIIENKERVERIDQVQCTVHDLVNSLSDRERKIIEETFGMNGNERKTLKVLGRELGITRERVRQIQSKALSKIAQHPSIEKLKEHFE